MRLVSLLMTIAVIGGGYWVRQHYQHQLIDQLKAETPSDGTFGPFDFVHGDSVTQSQIEAMNEMLSGSCRRSEAVYRPPEAKPPADVQANPFVD